MVVATNHISIQAFTSKSVNKVYLSTGFGISILKLDKKEIHHEFLFDKQLEELVNDNYCYEEDFLPKIA
ncbi:hypothetical protein SteCoe_40598 [Stentor coeruleus]|uniref:Uncharacterized protein n=1 Tax=Stentor coeruleus TaxID=5963 RepID=A0A1R2AKD7_9CILI|nr:hypothetical protein SteCoe_40598 [Stentor coeruleus]